MGFNQSSISNIVNASSDFKVSKTALFGAILAGFGIWTKPTKQVVKAVTTDKQQAEAMPSNIYPLHPPLRVIRVEDSSPKMAGRMVISGRMADVCAELDRLAA